MTTTVGNQPAHVLTIKRAMDAPVEAVWRCWTEPELLKRWFCPKPWFITDVCMDLKPGGEFSCVMHGPDGQRFDHIGVFLEVEPMRRLVMTDAFRPGWIPGDRAFVVAEKIFEDAGKGRTRYTARAMHWDRASLKEHERRGFHEGWGKAAEELETLAGSL